MLGTLWERLVAAIWAVRSAIASPVAATSRSHRRWDCIFTVKHAGMTTAVFLLFYNPAKAESRTCREMTILISW
jgi:hypothetical protein